MRSIILTALLLATGATPLLAQVPPAATRDYQRSDDRGDWRGDGRNDGRNGRRDVGQDRREVRDDRRDDRGDWRGNGRDDRRGDWRDDRRGYGGGDRQARYRGPAFYHPAGYGYRYYGPGARVPRAYFSSRYFIDPAPYRLPAVYGGTRWVRLGPDALLVRLYDGIVVRSVRGIFY